MREELIALTKKEHERFLVVRRVMKREMKQRAAAELLGLSARQVRIPRESGRVFRRKAATIPSEAGHGSDEKAAAFEPVVGKVAGLARKIAG